MPAAFKYADAPRVSVEEVCGMTAQGLYIVYHLALKQDAGSSNRYQAVPKKYHMNQ